MECYLEISLVSTSPEETIAEMAARWDELSALQVLSATVTPQPQIIKFLIRSKMNVEH